ncbi:putative N-acetyltransferase family 8 member 5 [Discoglossus pictus]
MSDYNIRLYKNSDYKVARHLFAQGMTEHTNAAFKHALRLQRNWLLMLFGFLIALFITRSIVLSTLVVTTVIVILWLCSRSTFHSYVQRCLNDDMKDIHKYYMQRDGYRFWVVESAGQVVGTVAFALSTNPKMENHMEMKRLSVAKSHRGKGIAKALCRTLIDFARERRYETVVLETSLAMSDARWLYEKMGFRLTQTFTPPGLKYKIIDFKVMAYQYDIPT